MNVLSLFDGMSCGQIALNKLGIKVDNYFASEIDTYAIKVTQKNYPNTKQIGNVVDVKGAELPKIDLMYGGSPCQGFSFSGKGLNFEDERSKLFFEFVRLLKETKPKYFLLENVKMKKESQDIISSYLGCEPIMINSSLFSGQNRPRYYWTNIANIEQPIDRGISLVDVMENDGTYLGVEPFKKCVRDNVMRQLDLIRNSKKPIQALECTSGWQDNKVGIYKSPCLRAGNGFVLGMNRNSYIRRLKVNEFEELQNVPFNYTQGVSDTQRKKMLGNGWTVDVIAHIFKGLKPQDVAQID